MHGNPPLLQQARLPGRFLWLILSVLIVFGLVTALLFNETTAKAAEPDLSLLKAAYATSAFNSPDLQLIGVKRTIPAAAFNPDSNSRTWFFGFNSSYIYPNSASGYCGIAPLYLPQGAILTSMAAYVYDNDASFDVMVSLFPKELGTTTSASQSAQVMSTGQSTALQVLVDTMISPSIIDNTHYTYHIGVCMFGADNNSRFYAVRVNYTLPPVYLPLIQR